MNFRNIKSHSTKGFTIVILIVLMISAILTVQMKPVSDEEYEVSRDTIDNMESEIFSNREERDDTSFYFDSTSYTSMGPISVNGDTDLLNQASSNGWAGNGSESNPIIILDYNISGSATYLLEIRNTDLHIKINHILIDGQNSRSYGAYIDGSANITISNSYFVNVLYRSLFISSSSNFKIDNNTIANGGNDGLYFSTIANSTISSNTVTNNDNIGIYLYQSSNNSVFENSISNSQIGLYLYQSQTNSITNNKLENCSLKSAGKDVKYHLHEITNNLVNGKPLIYWSTNQVSPLPTEVGQIIITNSSNIEIDNREITATSLAIDVSFSTNINISHMFLSDNEDGIRIYQANNITIRNNTLLNNTSTGIDLFDSVNVTIQSNYFGDIRSSGIFITGDLSLSISDSFITIKDNTFVDAYVGIHYVEEVVMENNYFTGGTTQSTRIILVEVGFSKFIQNTIEYDVGDVFSLSRSINNDFSQNIIFNNSGTVFDSDRESDYNIFNQNNISNNGGSAFFIEGSNNIIRNNSIFHNFGYGVLITGDSNTIDKNDFISNGYNLPQALDNRVTTGINSFNNNYWDDHLNSDADGDETTDHSYYITGVANNIDYNPAAEPYNYDHSLSDILLTYPVSDQNLSGIIVIQWEDVGDTLQHQILYNIYYNRGDSSWVILSTGQEEPEFTFDTTTLSDSDEYRIKIVAYDNFGLTTQVISEPFTIDNIDEQEPTVQSSQNNNNQETDEGFLPIDGMWGLSSLFIMSYLVSRKIKR